MERALKYIEKEGLVDDDDLWFVIDVDKWEKEQINEIYEYCKKHKNWNIVLSNPCIEVWLYYHIKDEIPDFETKDSNDLKNELHNLISGGYNKLTFIKFFLEAIKNSEKQDKNKRNYFPEKGTTKVYKLGKAIIKEVGISKFNEFIEVKLPELIKNQKKTKPKKTKS